MKQWLYLKLVVQPWVLWSLGRATKATWVGSYSYELNGPKNLVGKFHWDANFHAWATPIDEKNVFNTLSEVLARIDSSKPEPTN